MKKKISKNTASPNLPLNTIVEGSIYPIIDYLFKKLLIEKKDIKLDGVNAFNDRDKFLPGKIAIGLSYVLLGTPRNDAQFKERLDAYRQIADLSIDEHNETWGIYYYISALHRLKQAGLLEKAVSPKTLATLRKKLDWRTFVDTKDYSLISLPTNYYGVAFSVARLRHLLGWENKTASAILLKKTTDHYKAYSGQFGFSDETSGEGRFDRYSILLIGEICQRFIDSDMKPTSQLKKWLRNSVEIILVRMNAEGDGFDFGRSIGAYGDTSFIEVLSAAAYLNVLTKEEKDMAYAFQTRAAAKYVNFWYDPDMKSVNLWEKGRRTDGYRNKGRILGETLSLSHQHIYTNNLWNKMGYKGKAPSRRYEAWLKKRPRYTVTWFAKGEYDRALITFRDTNHTISLPIVNGGSEQHDNNPYFPIPFSHNLVQGAADTSFPQLIPRFVLEDGSELEPLAYTRGITVKQTGKSITVSYYMDEVDRLGGSAPIKDGRLCVETVYTIAPGMIVRTDTYKPAIPLRTKRIFMEFASFSQDATVEGDTVRFANGNVTEFQAQGLKIRNVENVESSDVYRAPMQQMKTRVTCSIEGPMTLEKSFTLSWKLKYK